MNRRSNDEHPNQEQITNASNSLADSVLQRGRWGQRFLKKTTALTSMVQRTPMALTNLNIKSLVQQMDQTGPKTKAAHRPIGLLSATFIDRSTPKRDNPAPAAQPTVQPIQRASEAHFQQPANLVWDGINESPTPVQEAAEVAETFPYTVAQIREALDRHQAGLPPATPIKRREPPIQRQAQSAPEQNPALPYTVAQIRDALDRLKSGQAGEAGQTPPPSSAIQRRPDDANPTALRSGPTILAELQRALSEAQPFEQSQQPPVSEAASPPAPFEDNVKVIQPRRSRQWVEAMALRHSKPFPPLPQKHDTTPDPGSMEAIQRQPAQPKPAAAPEPATDDGPDHLTNTVRRLPHPNESKSEAGTAPQYGADQQRQIDSTPLATTRPDLVTLEPKPTTAPTLPPLVPNKLEGDRIDSPASDRGQLQRQVEITLPEPTTSDSTSDEIVQEMTTKPQKVEPKPAHQPLSEPAPTSPPPPPIERQIQRQTETPPEPVAPNIVPDKTASKRLPAPQKVEPKPAYQPPVEPGPTTPPASVESQIQRQVETPSEPTTSDIAPGEIVEEAVTKPQKIEPKPTNRTPIESEQATPLSPASVERQIQRQVEPSPEPVTLDTLSDEAVKETVTTPQKVEPTPISQTPLQPGPAALPPPVEHQPSEPAMVDIVPNEPAEEVVTTPQKIEPKPVLETLTQPEPAILPPPTERQIQRQVETIPEPATTEEATPREIVEETVAAPHKIEPKPANQTPTPPKPTAPSPPVERHIQPQVEASLPEPTTLDIVSDETTEKATAASPVVEPDSINRARIQPEPAVSPPVKNQIQRQVEDVPLPQRQPVPKTEEFDQSASLIEVELDGSSTDTMAVLPQVRRQIEPNRERPDTSEAAASNAARMPLVWAKERTETRSQREAATPVSPPTVVQRAVEAAARPNSQDHVNGTIQRIEEAAPQPQTTESSRKKEAINLDRLARQVYPLVKQMLAVERERRPFR